MALSFSSADLNRLGVAQRVLLSPLDYEDPADWCAEACRAIRTLLGMDHASFFRSDAEDPVMFTDLGDDARRAYMGHYHTRDIATQRALRRGLEVAHLWDVMPREEFLRSELFHEYVRPHGLMDAMMMRVGTEPSASAWIAVQHGQALDEAEVEVKRALLQAVYPAFGSGVALWRRLAGWRTELARMLDALEEAIVVCDAAGRVLHTNPAFTEVLAADPENNKLRAAVEALARALAALARASARSGKSAAAPPGEQTIQTKRTLYRLRGSIVGRDLFRTGEAFLITLQPALSAQPSEQGLKRRFGLTPQEVRIACLLARGHSNAVISVELAISPHTVRRHTERVLHKLGIASRAQVAVRLHP